MTPQEIRTQYDFIAEIFELECKVKPDFAFHIVRNAFGVISIGFFLKGNALEAKYYHHWVIELVDIKTRDAMLAAINRIWQAIPAECKRIIPEKS